MAALPSWLVTRARAVSAGLGGDIAAPTVQRDRAWALQFRNTSCLSPQPEPARTASKAHSVPELLHQKPCSISPPPSLLAAPLFQHRNLLPHFALSYKSRCLCKAFYSCSQPALFFPCFAKHSHAILPSVSCPWPQQRSIEPRSGDFSSRHATFTTMLSPVLHCHNSCPVSPPGLETRTTKTSRLSVFSLQTSAVKFSGKAKVMPK